MAKDMGVSDAFAYPGFVEAYVRPGGGTRSGSSGAGAGFGVTHWRAPGRKAPKTK
jgi:hypothetical protein